MLRKLFMVAFAQSGRASQAFRQGRTDTRDNMSDTARAAQRTALRAPVGTRSARSASNPNNTALQSMRNSVNRANRAPVGTRGTGTARRAPVGRRS